MDKFSTTQVMCLQNGIAIGFWWSKMHHFVVEIQHVTLLLNCQVTPGKDGAPPIATAHSINLSWMRMWSLGLQLWIRHRFLQTPMLSWKSKCHGFQEHRTSHAKTRQLKVVCRWCSSARICGPLALGTCFPWRVATRHDYVLRVETNHVVWAEHVQQWQSQLEQKKIASHVFHNLTFFLRMFFSNLLKLNDLLP